MEAMKLEKPKIELKDLFFLSYNTDNLQKYIDYLVSSDSSLFKEINDLKIRMGRAEEGLKATTDIYFRLNVNEKKIDDVHKTLNSHQVKLMQIDSQLLKFDEVYIIIVIVIIIIILIT